LAQQALLEEEPFQRDLDAVEEQLKLHAAGTAQHATLTTEKGRLLDLQKLNRLANEEAGAPVYYKDRVSTKTLLVLVIPCLCDLFCKTIRISHIAADDCSGFADYCILL